MPAYHIRSINVSIDDAKVVVIVSEVAKSSENRSDGALRASEPVFRVTFPLLATNLQGVSLDDLANTALDRLMEEQRSAQDG